MPSGHDISSPGSHPLILHKTTVAEVTNTTAAAIEALDKANAGVTIPAGVFRAGLAWTASGTKQVEAEFVYEI